MCASAVALHKQMRNVHLNVFVDNLFKRIIGHILNLAQIFLQIHCRCKCKIALRYIHCADSSCKIMQTAKNIRVYLLQVFYRADFNFVYHSRLKQFVRFLFAFIVN